MTSKKTKEAKEGSQEEINFPERIIESKGLTQIRLTYAYHTGHSLYSLCKFEGDKIISASRINLITVFQFDKKTFRNNHSFKEIEIKGLRYIEDTDQVNCVKILQDNSIILCCTKPKIIRLTIVKNEAKIIEILDGSNYNCQQFYNAIEFDYNILIACTNTNILIWKKKSANNYSYKQNIFTGSDTNLVYINQNIFAAHINDNTIRFYDKNFEESGSRITNVKSRIEPLMMSMINEELLGVCGRGNSIIYLININTRKIIKEVKFNEFSSDYFSISTLPDSSIIVNNSTYLFILKLIKEGNNYDLKIILILGQLCGETFTFAHLFDEVFLHSCVNGHFFAYLNPNIDKLIDEKNNSKKEEDIIRDKDITKEIKEEKEKENKVKEKQN